MKNKIVLWLIWTMVSCSSLADVQKTLNGLTNSESLTAKIVVINSKRSFLGALSDPYYVFYVKGIL